MKYNVLKSVLRGRKLQTSNRGVLMNFNHKHNSGFLRGAVAILAIALGTALFPGAGEKASAGMCEQTTTTSGIWECSEAANPASDRQQYLTSALGGDLVVTTTDDFGMNVASGDSIWLVTTNLDLGIDATIDGLVSSRGDNGIIVSHGGTGAAAINVGAVVNAAEDGIYALTTAAADGITVNATGAITAGNRGINIDHQGTGAVVVYSGSINATDNGIDVETTAISQSSVTINAMGDISGSSGIKAEHLGRGELSIFLAPNANIMTTGSWGIDAAANTIGHTSNPPGGMNIMAMGDIGSSASPVRGGILADHDTRGDLNITVGGNIYTTGTSTGRGVDARTGTDASALNINVIGNITSGTGGIAVDHLGTGDATINIAPGASVNAPASMQTGIFAGASAGSDIVVDIAGMVRGDRYAVSTGSSADNVLVRLRPGANIIGDITAAAGPNAAFELAAATTPFANTPSFDLSQLSGFDTIRKTGPNTWGITTGTVGAVSADTFSFDDGALFLDEGLSVITANFEGNGGRLVMSANFASGGVDPDSLSALTIIGDLSGTIPVDLRISGNPDAAARWTAISVVGADGPNAANHFTGSADSGSTPSDLTATCRVFVSSQETASALSEK